MTVDEIMELVAKRDDAIEEMNRWDVGPAWRTEKVTEVFCDANKALRTALEALVKDAARYKWIKEHCVLGIYQNGNGWDMGIEGVAPDSKRDIDAAIDAAMEKQ